MSLMGKSYNQLNLKEREELYKKLQTGIVKTEIARQIGRDKSTIYRELARNKDSCDLGYLPDRANDMAAKRKSSHAKKLDSEIGLKNIVIDKLKLGWAPEAISGRMKLEDTPFKVCKETIYQFVYSNEGSCLNLYKYLPWQRIKRGVIFGRKPRRGVIPEATSIHERPQNINERKSFGHFEADLTFCRGEQSANIGVMVDRKSRFSLMVKNESKKANLVMKNMFNKLAELPHSKRKSATFDRGSEFVRHQLLRKHMNMKTYFCDPHSPWQKGQVEKTNALLHRYIPKKTSSKKLTPKLVNWAQNMLNNLPRKCLGFKTPMEIFYGKKYSFVALRT